MVTGLQQHGLRVDLGHDRLVEVALEARLHQSLRRAERDGRTRGKLAGERVSRVGKLFVGDDAMHQTERERVGCGEHAISERELE